MWKSGGKFFVSLSYCHPSDNPSMKGLTCCTWIKHWESLHTMVERVIVRLPMAKVCSRRGKKVCENVFRSFFNLHGSLHNVLIGKIGIWVERIFISLLETRSFGRLE